MDSVLKVLIMEGDQADKTYTIGYFCLDSRVGRDCRLFPPLHFPSRFSVSFSMVSVSSQTVITREDGGKSINYYCLLDDEKERG